MGMAFTEHFCPFDGNQRRVKIVIDPPARSFAAIIGLKKGDIMACRDEDVNSMNFADQLKKFLIPQRKAHVRKEFHLRCQRPG